MYKTRQAETIDASNNSQSVVYAETDPSGRYGRLRDILGKGAMKTVYRGFDEVLGMEVAWNQVKLNHLFKSPDEIHRLYSEVHLLKNLDHDSIMRFHTSWIDIHRRTFNFITEMFTSGTLREYRKKYKGVKIGAVKKWARQILEGLAYLHGHDPPVIHRDLKCDNIFVNGHLVQVKIGDLGLAAILRGGSHHAHSVIGTPEFMAPELYEEEYDELVDIYSFGMCVLEMLTSEYPYSECSNPAQIYKKVTSGKLPEAFYRVQDIEAQKLIGKCLGPASKRPSARELLMDSFLCLEEEEEDKKVSKLVPCDANKLMNEVSISSVADYHSLKTTDMTITGTMKPEHHDTIFLKVRISSKHGEARNIYFPFEISSDTALDVAREMVKELDITDWNPIEIAEMIDAEISALVPSWNDVWDVSRDQLNRQYMNFDYDEDDDDDEDDDSSHPPYHSLSSHSSSHASLPGLIHLSSCQPPLFHSRNDVMISGYDWPPENLNNFDDASSQSSMNSYKFSNMTYLDRDQELVLEEEEISSKIGKTGINNIIMSSSCSSTTTTRFCNPDQVYNLIMTKNSSKKCSYGTRMIKNSNINHRHDQVKNTMTRVRSMVDLRSQLLHRSLVEEVNKRRMFKTVGAVENIGYYDPGDFSGNLSSSEAKGGGGGRDVRRSVKNLSPRQGFEW